MIHKSLNEVTLDDLRFLVTNNVPEGKTLEYKAKLPDDSKDAKKEFLADISSLANTDGGDLVFGISEEDGNLSEEIGINIDNIDLEIARLENILREGIEPRISVNIKVIDVNDKKLLILRTKSSMDGPHRVIFSGHDRFYKRNTNGKYPIDVHELRTAFLQSADLIDRIRRFRNSRIQSIKSSETPLLLTSQTSFIAIHIIPITSFTTSFKIPSNTIEALSNSTYGIHLKPFYSSGYSHRINLDGVVGYTSYQDPVVRTYVQLYRDGKIEAVETSIIQMRNEDGKKTLPISAIENKVIEYVTHNVALMGHLDIQPPYFIFLSLVGIDGFTLMLPQGYFSHSDDKITQSDLLLPEIVLESLNDKIDQKLQPVFDMIWNAGGFSKSLSYDDDGSFKLR